LGFLGFTAIIDGQERYEMTERIFDWVSRHDPESRRYKIKPLLASRKIEKKPVFWQEGVVLDQGSEGACVGFAWMGELLAEPESPKSQPSFGYANSLAISFYNEAKTVDEWPGESYEGTSVLAGAKVMKKAGFIGEYRWCFSIDEVRDAVISEGPVVIGIPWFGGMYDTLDNGLVKLAGQPTGGHAILITGYHPRMRFGSVTHEVFRWRNSWGTDYGVEGSGWIKYKDLAKLLADNGEACVPMQREIPVFNEPKRNIFARLFKK
jgi:hypothetical protein